MRTLLVDNYDSFTGNLFHYLAEVNGREPSVVRNDDPGWRLSLLDGFDNVVLSPGPGSPERAADFGLCREVVTHGRVPLLGVCLGHQGLAYLHGGRVGRAAEPWHGRLSPVHHTGTDLFAGLPSPVRVVRYHSLTVTDLPPELQALAWTTDGVLMGLRHRHRPQWGVQFHPESIATEHGHALLANFRDLTGAWWERQPDAVPRRVARPGGTRARPGRDGGTLVRPAPVTGPGPGPPARARLEVLVRDLPTGWTGEAVYDALYRTLRHSVWLDSSRPDDRAGRFSVLAGADGPLARVAYADVWHRRVRVESATGVTTVESGFLDFLDADLRSLDVRVPPLPCGFALGWVGYLGYELKAECDGDRAHRSTEPDAAMLFADRAVVLDHATGRTYLLALAPVDDDREAADWLDRTAARLSGLSGVASGAAAGPWWVPGEGGPRLRHDPAAYLSLVRDCQEAIGAGETYEVCLTNQIRVAGRLDPWVAYRVLRRSSPAPYAALLRFGDLAVLSSSPERFLRVAADGTVESRPIKGTRPRGATPAEDELLRAELAGSEKDRSENLMIVDLVRHDLGRCARVGTVTVAGMFEVETYATVHQLVSTVRAELRPGLSAVDCVRAAFPGGSMTGAPKIRTMRIIDRLEGGPRGVYAGSVGYFSLSGAADLSIVIRTLVVTPSEVRYGTGGAVVALSDPEDELRETAVKAAPLLRLLGVDFPAAAGSARPVPAGSA
jgi:para-aminobenzoate synthetase